MRKSKFTDEQIAYALHQAEVGTAPSEICRRALESVLQAPRRITKLLQSTNG